MKKLLILSGVLNVILFLFLSVVLVRTDKLSAILRKVGLIESMDISELNTNDNKWKTRESIFDVLPNDSLAIVFLGNSITENCEWQELLQQPNIINRGIDGDMTFGVLARIENIIDMRPLKIFIEIGINDIILNVPLDTILKNYSLIIQQLQHECPNSEIYAQSILPVFNNFNTATQKINQFNSKLKLLSEERGVTYIDINSHFCLNDGSLDPRYTFDGIHLNGIGYLLWKEVIDQYLK